MTTNLQDTGNLRSIAHKLLKKIYIKTPSLHTLQQNVSRLQSGKAAEQGENGESDQ